MTDKSDKRPVSIPLDTLSFKVPAWQVERPRPIRDCPEKSHLCLITLAFDFGGVQVYGRLEYPASDADKICMSREIVRVTVRSVPGGFELFKARLNGDEDVELFSVN